MIEINEKILKVAKDSNGVGAKYLKEWKGFSVYNIVYPGTKTRICGFPFVILATETEARLSTFQECLDFWGFHYNFKKG